MNSVDINQRIICSKSKTNSLRYKRERKEINKDPSLSHVLPLFTSMTLEINFSVPVTSTVNDRNNILFFFQSYED